MPKAQGHIIVTRRARKGEPGDGGLVISVTPDSLVWKEGKPNKSIVGVSVMEGSDEVPYLKGNDDVNNGGFICSTIVVPEGMKWNFRTKGNSSKAKKEFEYLISSVGDWHGTDVELPFSVKYKGRSFDYLINITTVKDGIPGDPGIDGCILRTTTWTEGVRYHNDKDETHWPRYIDQIVVEYPPGSNMRPYDVYLCIQTHDSTKDITYTDGRYWRKMNEMSPIYTPMLLAQYAMIKFSQTNRLLVEDLGHIIAGMGGGDYPLWIGGDSYDSPLTKFRVSKEGYINAVGGVFSGFVRHSPTIITPENYKKYLEPINDGSYMLDMESCGTYLIFEDSPSKKWRDADNAMQQALKVSLPGFREGVPNNNIFSNYFELIGNTIIVENKAIPPENLGFVPTVRLLTFMEGGPIHTIEPETVGVGECKFAVLNGNRNLYSVYWDFHNTKPNYTKPKTVSDSKSIWDDGEIE